MTLGESIRNARKTRGMTQKDLAKKIKVRPGYLCDIEKEKITTTTRLLKKIAQALSGDLLMVLR